MVIDVAPIDLAGDLDRVVEIEAASFSRPWTREMFIGALERAPGTLVRVARAATAPVIGYGVGQVVVDELHLHTVAVAAEWRDKGVGRRLLAEMLDVAAHHGATAATLEVRATNAAARRLYERAGFVCAAVRAAAYHDPTEAALVYWRRGLDRRGSAWLG